MRTFLFLLLAASPLITFAQKDTLISEHLDTFSARTRIFERWLDTLGLNQVVAVAYARLRPDDPDELELLLLIRADSADRAYALWQKTAANFKVQTGWTIYEEMYRTFTNIMEIPPEQGNIQIYLRDPNGEYSKYFYVWIWQDPQTHQLVDSVYYVPTKSYAFHFEIPDLRIKKAVRGKSKTITKKRSAGEVFEVVRAMVQEKYPVNKYENDKICQNRWPQVVWEPSPENQLAFSISDLCREVLSNSELSVWCKMAKSIGWDKSCNDIKREKLTFYFNYSPTAQGYRIDCKVTGLFGSGVYVPRASGYMSMDPDFLDFEAEYAKKFQYELEQRLKK